MHQSFYLLQSSSPIQPNASFSLVDAIWSRLAGLSHRLEIHLVVCCVHQISNDPDPRDSLKHRPTNHHISTVISNSGERLPFLLINCARFAFFMFSLRPTAHFYPRSCGLGATQARHQSSNVLPRITLVVLCACEVTSHIASSVSD